MDHARDLVQRALTRLNTTINEKAEEVRRLELERYDHWLSRLAPAIKRGDTKAIGTALRISEARRKLLGIDAPQQVSVTGDGQAEALAAILHRLKEADAS
jgi:hypothetical protein